MRFLLSRDLRDNVTIRWLLVGYLIGVFAYLTASPVYESSQLGLFPSDLVHRVLGSRDLFLSPKSLTDVVVNLHVKMFLNSLIALILSSLLVRLSTAGTSKLAVACLFGLPVLESLSLVLLSQGLEFMSYVKAFAFVGLWTLQCGVSVVLLRYLLRTPR